MQLLPTRLSVKYFFIRLWYYQIWGGVRTFRIHFDKKYYHGGDHIVTSNGITCRCLGNNRYYKLEEKPYVSPIRRQSLMWNADRSAVQARDDAYGKFLMDYSHTAGYNESSSSDDDSIFSGFGGGHSGGGGAEDSWSSNSDNSDSSDYSCSSDD